MPQYIGLIHQDPGSDFGVSFPDFPGAITAGSTLDEAHAMAEELLAFHVQGMLEDGEAIPDPSSLEAIMADVVRRGFFSVTVFMRALLRAATGRGWRGLAATRADRRG